tara:strand:- start:7681 stop:8154 length:474 start_codon:yes stop_codon:yes gene_type:complete
MIDSKQSSSEFDRYDRKILEILAENGRLTITELADRIGLSKTPCQNRVKRLEKDGVIRGYRAVLDPVSMDAAHIAFVEVQLSDTREAALRAFNVAVQGLRPVESCHMIAGGFDYLLKVRTRDIASYRKFLGETLSALPNVAQTRTYVVMEAVKDTGA